MQTNRAIEQTLASSWRLMRFGSKVTLETGKFIVAASVQVGETVGAQLPWGRSHIADRLKTTMPLEVALQGAQDIERGLEHGDEQLLQLGEAAITLAMIKAAESPKVPDEITQEIVQISDAQQIDPVTTPLISDELAVRALEVRQDFLPQE